MGGRETRPRGVAWAGLVVKRVQVRSGSPFRLDLGEHVSWSVENPAHSPELVQIDRVRSNVWLTARLSPGEARNLFLLVERAHTVDRVGLVLVAQE